MNAPIRKFLSGFTCALILAAGFGWVSESRAVLKAVSQNPTGTFTSVTTGTLTTTGLFTQAGEDSITAFATGGQTSATALSATKNLHRVSTVATAGDSVKLPAALVGQAHYVRNDGAAAMQVFGAGTDTINGVATATGVAQSAGSGAWYVSTTAGAWTTISANLFPDGTATYPSIAWQSDSDGTGTGLYRPATAQVGITINGVLSHTFTSTSLNMASASAAIAMGVSGDAIIADSGINQFRFGTAAGSTITSRTELNKTTAAIANAVATTVMTITIPNAAHSASVLVRVTCSLGAGGAIGANEATATNTYVISVNRTAGVNANAAISTAFGAAASAVAGAATVTATAALAAVSGAVGATNTYDIQATVSRSGGSSTNHTCLTYGQLMNANATGITLS